MTSRRNFGAPGDTPSGDLCQPSPISYNGDTYYGDHDDAYCYADYGGYGYEYWCGFWCGNYYEYRGGVDYDCASYYYTGGCAHCDILDANHELRTTSYELRYTMY